MPVVDLFKVDRASDIKLGSLSRARVNDHMNSCKSLVVSGLVGIAWILTTACGSDSFNYGKVGGIIQGAPMRLDAEYVMLSPALVDCGVQADLWDPPTESGGRSTARLTQKARDLKFADDVSIGDMKTPYVQIRGEFTLVAVDVQSDREGPDKDSKFVDVKLGVPITHSCFPNPLLMMGVRKGNFTQDYAPVLLFRYNNGWYIDRIMH
jgi:hypothetical protein